MLHKTKGIVLNYIKYSESSIIVRIYTHAFGLQSYIVNGVRSKSAKNKIALFQPLTLLDMVVYHKTNTGLQRISEVKLYYPYKSIPFDFKKITMGIFLTEVLSKCLKEESSYEELFLFVEESLILFDRLETEYENFHIQFLLLFSQYLGFQPGDVNDILPRNTGTGDEEKQFIETCLEFGYTPITISNSTRRNALEHLLRFYAIHVENFGEMNSLKVLREVMS